MKKYPSENLSTFVSRFGHIMVFPHWSHWTRQDRVHCHWYGSGTSQWQQSHKHPFHRLKLSGLAQNWNCGFWVPYVLPHSYCKNCGLPSANLSFSCSFWGSWRAGRPSQSWWFMHALRLESFNMLSWRRKVSPTLTHIALGGDLGNMPFWWILHNTTKWTLEGLIFARLFFLRLENQKRNRFFIILFCSTFHSLEAPRGLPRSLPVPQVFCSKFHGLTKGSFRVGFRGSLRETLRRPPLSPPVSPPLSPALSYPSKPP